ncbi:hypothetical protein CASFOL_000899 [Castilleja foliolosa]|uniref:RNase H type-1 domain-containing protein n=1 Tax=Castilleja foliolosa TaxID=1961234 RepID=A0ABD3ELA4_9LAMI
MRGFCLAKWINLLQNFRPRGQFFNPRKKKHGALAFGADCWVSFDGSIRSNGLGAIAGILRDCQGDPKLRFAANMLGEVDINSEAELYALQVGLQWLIEKASRDNNPDLINKTIIETDSFEVYNTAETQENNKLFGVSAATHDLILATISLQTFMLVHINGRFVERVSARRNVPVINRLVFLIIDARFIYPKWIEILLIGTGAICNFLMFLKFFHARFK